MARQPALVARAERPSPRSRHWVGRCSGAGLAGGPARCAVLLAVGELDPAASDVQVQASARRPEYRKSSSSRSTRTIMPFSRNSRIVLRRFSEPVVSETTPPRRPDRRGSCRRTRVRTAAAQGVSDPVLSVGSDTTAS